MANPQMMNIAEVMKYAKEKGMGAKDIIGIFDTPKKIDMLIEQNAILIDRVNYLIDILEDNEKEPVPTADKKG